MVYYVEIGFHAIDIPLYRRIQVQESGYLTRSGLILSSAPTNTTRMEDKILNIDDIRAELFIRYESQSFIRDVSPLVRNMTYAISHLLLDWYPRIYNTALSGNYTFLKRQGQLFTTLVARYDCDIVVRLPSSSRSDGKRMTFQEFTKWVGSTIVLDSHRGVPDGHQTQPAYPSLRQLIQHLVSVVNVNGAHTTPPFSCAIVGGDAFRRYDSSILFSDDIDAKFFYTHRQYVAVYKHVVNYLVFLMYVYLKHNRYFRFDYTWNIDIGGIPFMLNINTLRQEVVTRYRYLPRFVVPLSSIDVKLKSTLTGNGLAEVPFVFKYAPFDIAFSHVDTLPPIEQHVYTPEIFAQVYGAASFPSVIVPIAPVYRDSTRLLITPVVPLEWLMHDVSALLDNKDRLIAGKRDKDILRHKRVQDLHRAGAGNMAAWIHNISGLEQLGWVHSSATQLRHDILSEWDACIQDAMDYIQLNTIPAPRARTRIAPKTKTTANAKTARRASFNTRAPICTFISKYLRVPCHSVDSAFNVMYETGGKDIVLPFKRIEGDIATPLTHTPSADSVHTQTRKRPRVV